MGLPRREGMVCKRAHERTLLSANKPKLSKRQPEKPASATNRGAGPVELALAPPPRAVTWRQAYDPRNVAISPCLANASATLKSPKLKSPPKKVTSWRLMEPATASQNGAHNLSKPFLKSKKERPEERVSFGFYNFRR